MQVDNKYTKVWFIRLMTVISLLNVFTSAEPCHGMDTTQYSVPVSNKTASMAELICSGRFVTARQLLAAENETDFTENAYLADVISEYKAIEKKRQIVRANIYQEQLGKLEKLRKKNNEQETCDIIDLLEVIRDTIESAANEQKQVLLEDIFVKQTIEKAIAKAEEFNANAQWSEAYKRYYWWLEKIDPDNHFYSDRANQLADKADIKASLQDSPCQTRDERYKGVEPQIFIEAINTLDTDYVVRIIDYRQI